MNRKQLEYLREQYPRGSRIKLNQTMDDPFRPVPKGMMGTVEHIDDTGTIHMSWDNGQGLGLIVNEDDFTLIEKARELKVIIVEPNQEPRIENIYDTLYHMQKVVGGDIEMIKLDDDTILTCNEEGKLLHLEPNRSINGDVIVGTFFIARDDGSDQLQSLTEEQIEKYMSRFMEIENEMDEEIKMGGL